jgi:hypothetical protein
MTTNKTFSVAGVSTLNGVTKVRFANDLMRVKVLDKSGHTDVILADLEGEYTKLEAAAQLLALPDFSDEQIQAVINDYISENTPVVKASKAPKASKATATVEATPVIESVATTSEVVTTEDENAPF